jgi:hypothetical protein
MFGFKPRTDPKLFELEKRLEKLESRFTSVTADVLDATERLQRITRRSFRLNESLNHLEAQGEQENKKTSGNISRSDVLRMAQNR